MVTVLFFLSVYWQSLCMAKASLQAADQVQVVDLQSDQPLGN